LWLYETLHSLCEEDLIRLLLVSTNTKLIKDMTRGRVLRYPSSMLNMLPLSPIMMKRQKTDLLQLDLPPPPLVVATYMMLMMMMIGDPVLEPVQKPKRITKVKLLLLLEGCHRRCRRRVHHHHQHHHHLRRQLLIRIVPLLLLGVDGLALDKYLRLQTVFRD
jgi:hypothetical protein